MSSQKKTPQFPSYYSFWSGRTAIRWAQLEKNKQILGRT